MTLAHDSVVDGDTLRVPDPAPQAWGAAAARLRLGADGRVVLRLAGIDAPESFHPGAPSGLTHQPQGACAVALAALSGELDRAAGGRIAVQLTGVDRYGRALAVVWAMAARRDAAKAMAAAALHLADSVNARLLACGAAYPDLHDGLAPEDAALLSALARQARRKGLGLWPLDCSAEGVDLGDWQALAQQRLVLPRLFRRIGNFWQALGATAAGRFPGADRSAGVDPAGHQPGVGESTAASPISTVFLNTQDALDSCFREFLEQRGGWLRPLDGGTAQSFAEWVEIRQSHVAVRGEVENFLYQSGSGTEKLT